MAHVFENGVYETSTTTGTGVMTLAGAVTGYRPFNLVCSIGDTVHYRIDGVTSDGSPAGPFEIGRGTYSGANQLTRTTVYDSSNSNAPVNFLVNTRIALIVLAPNTSAQVQLDWQQALGTNPRGGGNDRAIFENDQVLTNNYTITAGKNAHTVGPFSVATGKVLTVPTGSRFLVL